MEPSWHISDSSSIATARMSPAQVVASAKRCAARQGIAVQDFDPPVLYYNGADQRWILDYPKEGTRAALHPFLLIFVNDQTKEAEVVSLYGR
jgi:hypothetical protein